MPVGRPPEGRDEILYARISAESKAYLLGQCNANELATYVDGLILYDKHYGPGKEDIMAKATKKPAKKTTKKPSNKK
jgi:hypothetical protein